MGRGESEEEEDSSASETEQPQTGSEEQMSARGLRAILDLPCPLRTLFFCRGCSLHRKRITCLGLSLMSAQPSSHRSTTSSAHPPRATTSVTTFLFAPRVRNCTSPTCHQAVVDLRCRAAMVIFHVLPPNPSCLCSPLTPPSDVVLQPSSPAVLRADESQEDSQVRGGEAHDQPQRCTTVSPTYLQHTPPPPTPPTLPSTHSSPPSPSSPLFRPLPRKNKSSTTSKLSASSSSSSPSSTRPSPSSSSSDVSLVRHVPRPSTSLFFRYNTALGPPYQLLLDTNFINFSIQNKLDIVTSAMDCLLAKVTPLITDCVMGELERLGAKYRVALRVAKDERFGRLRCGHKGVYADDCLVRRVEAHKCYIVATCDRDLKRRLRKVPGVPIMYITKHQFSIERFADVNAAPRE